MEKHNFKDRSPQSKNFNAVKVGSSVLVCEKHMQSTASQKEDLTKGRVVQKLTKRDHPMGIKVKILTDINEYKIGRVIYLLEDK